MRDGSDYVVKDQQLGVMMRGPDLNCLRKACHWLQWNIEDLEIVRPRGFAPEQLLSAAHSDRKTFL
jgi:hypothetical protein